MYHWECTELTFLLLLLPTGTIKVLALLELLLLFCTFTLAELLLLSLLLLLLLLLLSFTFEAMLAAILPAVIKCVNFDFKIFYTGCYVSVVSAEDKWQTPEFN